MKKTTLLLLTTIILLFVGGCAAVQELINVREPIVKVDDVRMTGLSFQDINLIVDVSIENPNQLSTTLAGFDYSFKLNNLDFLNGTQTEQTSIAALGKSNVEVPLSLNFQEIYQTVTSLKDSDSTGYAIEFGLDFDLPVLGRTRIPVSKSGFLPMLKVPSIKVGSLKLDRVGFTSADLNLQVEIDNPNAYSMLLNKMNYDFTINGNSWANGISTENLSVGENGKSTINVPISLNFLEMGQTVYQLVTGDKSLNYELNGDLDLNTSIPLMEHINLPMSKSGQINISK